MVPIYLGKEKIDCNVLTHIPHFKVGKSTVKFKNGIETLTASIPFKLILYRYIYFL